MATRRPLSFCAVTQVAQAARVPGPDGAMLTSPSPQDALWSLTACDDDGVTKSIHGESTEWPEY